jgi:glutamate/tyrosine decarboxylase-like PLP-dependent enzyme
VAPTTVHPTIDKAAHYFGLKVVHTPVGADFKADVQAMKEVRIPSCNLIKHLSMEISN